jgi:hypothetical protein
MPGPHTGRKDGKSGPTISLTRDRGSGRPADYRASARRGERPLRGAHVSFLMTYTGRSFKISFRLPVR